MKRLEEIVGELERNDFSLEESLAKFEEGLEIGKLCKATLEKAEARVKTLVEQDDGSIAEEEASDDI
jgi:exodeoxyribonuclease VII small subunit